MNKIYEIKRTSFHVKDIELNNLVKKMAFLVGVENPTDREREKAIEFQNHIKNELKKLMVPNKKLESLSDYKDKKFAIIPSVTNNDETSYIIVAFDMDSDSQEEVKLNFDKEKELFYLETK